MTPDERIAHINKVLTGLPAWSDLMVEIDARIADLTEQLINNDNEQTRGRIKALRDVKGLPEALYTEREGISAALADEAAAD